MPRKTKIGRPRNFDKGHRVVFSIDDVPMRGTVSAYNGAHLRIVGVDGRQFTTKRSEQGCFVVKDSIEHERFGVFVFDTALDDDDTASRQSASFWKEFCTSSGWDFQYERIHSMSDLKFFLVDRKISHPVIIFNGHGEKDSGWKLSNGDKLNDKTFDFEPNNHNKGKIVIFSACEVGSNKYMSDQLKDKFCAEALYAYNCVVFDSMCFLIESLLLTYIDDDYRSVALKNHYDDLKNGTQRLTKINSDQSREYPLVMY